MVNCPVCKSEAKISNQKIGDFEAINCPRCGVFNISRTATTQLRSSLGRGGLLAIARLSHAIRSCYGYSDGGNSVRVNSTDVDEMINRPLPHFKDQKINFLKWLRERLGDRRQGSVQLPPLEILSGIVGAVDDSGVKSLMSALLKEDLVEFTSNDHVAIKEEGWNLLRKNKKISGAALQHSEQVDKLQETESPIPQCIVLCLSGGGLRAAFYHLGVIRSLRHAGLTKNVKYIFSVSGGSILAVHLALHWNEYVGTIDEFSAIETEFLKLATRDLRGRVVRRSILTFLTMVVPVRFTPKAFQSFRLGLIEWFERELSYLFGKKTFSDISRDQPLAPELHVLATNLITGELVSFSKKGYHIEGAENSLFGYDSIKLSLAVAASAAFPPLFPPVQLHREMLAASVGEFPISPHLLTDGGVYDNLGVDKLVSMLDKKELSTDLILVSDAGAPFDWNVKSSYSWPLSRTARTVDILMNRVAESTMAKSFSRALNAKIIHCPIEFITSDGLPDAIQKRLRTIRTDLDLFNDVEVQCLADHGHRVAETKLSEGFPSLISNFETSQVSKKSYRVSVEDAVTVLEKSGDRRWNFFNASDWASYAIMLSCLLVFGFIFYFSILKPSQTAERSDLSAQLAVGSTEEVSKKLSSQIDDLKLRLKEALGQKSNQAPTSDTAVAADPALTACRDPSNGIESYQGADSVAKESGWMSGGHNQAEWCNNLISSLRMSYVEDVKFEVVSSSETKRSRCKPFNCPEYNYFCTVQVSKPLYLKKVSSACNQSQVK